ncbi:hypothetical protein TIFTF001_045203 [Ficus carica]|uniref:Uncharacterized protein n=1 Tax=Ficus carica TaxID=3494 RepID=A0AA87YUX6_FICCA|nr:hypothetical protein TIFTF001_045203 [Ficus carica]
MPNDHYQVGPMLIRVELPRELCRTTTIDLIRPEESSRVTMLPDQSLHLIEPVTAHINNQLPPPATAHITSSTPTTCPDWGYTYCSPTDLSIRVPVADTPPVSQSLLGASPFAGEQQ